MRAVRIDSSGGPNGMELASIARLIYQGHVRPQVTSVLSLADAKLAHEMSESGHTKGKTVLRVARDPA